MEFRLSIEGLDEVKKDLKQFNERVRAGLLREVKDTTLKIHKQAKEDAPKVSGELHGGIAFANADLSGEVWSGAAHAIDVEKGTKGKGKWSRPRKSNSALKFVRPSRNYEGWPNVEDLTYWVRKKINPPTKKLRSVVFLVGRKIYEKGTKAQPYFEPAVKKHGKDFHRRVMKLLKRL